MIIDSIARLNIKNKSQYFPVSFERPCRNTKVELDLVNYAVKTDLKRSKDTDTSTLASKTDFLNF